MSSTIFDRIKNKLSKTPNTNLLSQDGRMADVYVNVYDMISMNGYLSVFGAGVYHSGVEIYDIEYCFGGHPDPISGIFEMAPRDVSVLGDNYSFRYSFFDSYCRTSIKVGSTDFTETDVTAIITGMGEEYRGDQYHLLTKNCNHFAASFVNILTGSQFPSWINRLAHISHTVPFIRKNIPKEWLTPQNMDGEDAIDGSGPDQALERYRNRNECRTPSSSESNPSLLGGTLRNIFLGHNRPQMLGADRIVDVKDIPVLSVDSKTGLVKCDGQGNPINEANGHNSKRNKDVIGTSGCSSHTNGNNNSSTDEENTNKPPVSTSSLTDSLNEVDELLAQMAIEEQMAINLKSL